MPRIFKADRPDFDLPVAITVTDSEGNPIPDAALPPGFTLIAESDNEEAFSILQDDANPLLFHCHVGSPGNATLTATLTNVSGETVAIDAEAIVVTVGDPAAVSGIDFKFPDDVVSN